MSGGGHVKWFKHLVASTGDPDLMESEVRFKADGPYVFWRAVEIMAREDAHCKPLTINRRVFEMYFPSVSAKRLRTILSYFQDKKRFTVRYSEENLVIFCDKLSTISAPYAAKVATQLKLATKPVTIIEEEEEEEKAKDPAGAGLPYLVVNNEWLSEGYWKRLVKLFGEEQAKRVVFYSRSALSPKAWIESGMKEGYASVPTAEDEDNMNTAALEKWFTRARGLAVTIAGGK